MLGLALNPTVLYVENRKPGRPYSIAHLKSSVATPLSVCNNVYEVNKTLEFSIPTAPPQTPNVNIIRELLNCLDW
jgi:hypothetical protein